MEHTGTSAAAPSGNMMRRVAIASCIGTTVEWYDFFIYATASALVFNKLFFPSFDPLVGSLVALATYAAGFFVRPIGGLLFGYLGDRYGRKSALVTTLLIVGIALWGLTRIFYKPEGGHFQDIEHMDLNPEDDK